MASFFLLSIYLFLSFVNEYVKEGLRSKTHYLSVVDFLSISEVEEADGDLIDQTVRFQCGATYR